jgi:hypothetical protein
MKPVTAVKKNGVPDRTQALHQFTPRGWVKIAGWLIFLFMVNHRNGKITRSSIFADGLKSASRLKPLHLADFVFCSS